jgi:hypothetical protein
VCHCSVAVVWLYARHLLHLPVHLYIYPFTCTSRLSQVLCSGTNLESDAVLRAIAQWLWCGCVGHACCIPPAGKVERATAGRRVYLASVSACVLCAPCVCATCFPKRGERAGHVFASTITQDNFRQKILFSAAKFFSHGII